MTFNVSFDIDVVAIILAMITLAVWGMRRIMRFFDWLESILPTKLMFLAFSLAFALCALLQIRGLDPSYPIPQLQIVFQAAAFAWFIGALLACTLATLVTLIDGVDKYMNRTRYIFIDHFDPNDPRF